MISRDVRAERQAKAARAVRVLASVAPEHRGSHYDVSGSAATTMAWLGVLDAWDNQEVADWYASPKAPQGGHPSAIHVIARSPEVDALERYDAMTPGISHLSLGWLWATGTATVDGETRQVIRPLASRTITLKVTRRSAQLFAHGQWDLWPFVADTDHAAELEQRIAFGGGGLTSTPSDAFLRKFPQLKQWANEVLQASGIGPVTGLTADGSPRQVPQKGLDVIVGYGLFTEGHGDLLRPQATLTSWSHDDGLADTALASMYLGPPPGDLDGRSAGAGDEPLARPLSPLPLSQRQTEAARRARVETISVVSGPPGTGKSQTAAAIASDAVARGERVLVATQSAMAADVLAELLDQVPGPTPVLFGGGRRASELAAKLIDDLTVPTDDGADRRLQEARQRRQELTEAIETDLGDLKAAQAWQEASLTAQPHRTAAPKLFEGFPGDTVAASAAMTVRISSVQGLFGTWRRQRAERALRELVGSSPETTSEAIDHAISVARLRNRAHEVEQRDVDVADSRWASLMAADDQLMVEIGRHSAATTAARRTRAAHRAVAALATALRAGRSRRREHLERVDVSDLTVALPLWIGTLGEIEALLPATAGAFDLVVLDEASAIDQMSASAALLRAKRAVVIGDPRQLRFVSFLSDRDVSLAIEEHECEPLADRLDLRRVSAYDLAASAAPVTFLDEHFRSVPHLIGFSAERFYDGRLQPVTRHPSNDGATAIEVREIDGTRVGGVNQAEIDAAVTTIAELVGSGATSVGVISPHRDQTDKLREGVAAALYDRHLDPSAVRVATVHGFQGSECDTMIASFGLSDGAGRGRHFVEDPHLFNVAITRARQRMIVLTSVTDHEPGLLSDYLTWAAKAPVLPPNGDGRDAWTRQLGEVLASRGVTTHLDYRVGPWVVDLVVANGSQALAVATGVHASGPASHIRQHLALGRAGWTQAEAFPTDAPDGAVSRAMELERLLG